MASKVIKGKMYNTKTATRVGYWDNGLFSNDCWFEDEELFRKKTGEYFLWVRILSGELSFCNYQDPQRGIIPLSEDQAKEWAELRLDGEKYEEIFGEVKE